jgi:hypothetical protein
MKVALCPALAAGLVLCACGNRAPSVPSVTGPAIAQRADSATFFYPVAFDRDGDSLSYQLDWGDGTLSEWTAWEDEGIEVLVAHAFADTGRFGVRAKARDVSRESGWSESTYVTVAEVFPNVPHQPSGPETLPVGKTAVFITLATHQLNKKIAIQFDWGDTLGDWSEFMYPGELYLGRHAFGRGGSFAVQARAKDQLEHVTDWSKPESVIVLDTFGFRRPAAGPGE